MIVKAILSGVAAFIALMIVCRHKGDDPGWSTLAAGLVGLLVFVAVAI